MADYKNFEDFFIRVTEATGIASQADLAAALGINRAAVSIAKRKNTVPEKWILQLAAQFALRPDWLREGSGNRAVFARKDFYSVPRLSVRLSAGGGSFEHIGAIREHFGFPEEWLRRKGRPESMMLMDVVGDSMEPELHDGDMVLVDESQQELLTGVIYALGVEDSVLVKRVQRAPGQLILISDNARYEPVRLRGDELELVRVIGRVLWAGRSYC